MEEKKELYRGLSVRKSQLKNTVLQIAMLVILCAAVCTAARHLPYGWSVEIAAIVVAAVLVNKILNNRICSQTYILYEDEFVIVTKYGLAEKETLRQKISDLRFSESKIVFGTQTYNFYPDKMLKSLLNL